MAPKRLRNPKGMKFIKSIVFWYSNLKHFWHPSRIPCFPPKKFRGPNMKKFIESINFWYSNPKHFWHPSRIRFCVPKNIRGPNGRKIPDSICFWHSKSQALLIPLSDPTFGPEKVPEPKRKENQRINMFFGVQILSTSGTPLGSESWFRKHSQPQTQGKSWNQYVFGFQIT